MGDLGNIITLEDFSIRDDQKIRDCIAKSNVVINLIGQNTETWNYKFKEVCLFTVLLCFTAKHALLCHSCTLQAGCPCRSMSSGLED